MGAVPEANIRDTLTANGWRIDFLGPTTYLAQRRGFGGGEDAFRRRWRNRCRPRRSSRCGTVAARFTKIAELLDGDRIHLPFTVVHAHRVD